MWLKNNSNNEWLGYETGSMKIDIKAGATFEVPDGVGNVLLKNLGSDKWLVKVEKEEDGKLPVEKPNIKDTEDDVKEEEVILVEKEEAPKKKK